MSTYPHINVIIAVTAPIISSGLAHCLRHIPELRVSTSEVSTYRELIDACHHNECAIAIVSPSFNGIFNPSQFRNDAPDDTRLLALESGPIPSHTLKLFDASISVIDDVREISRKIKGLINDNEETPKSKDQLSQREKEIIALVVKGMTNKEIADSLFISIHTVITHRRNIARKLEIHSATGLTIYAIVNHIVDIEEIKL